MAVSLFRRWRSQKFQDLVGQESVVSTLQNVLQGGSPARAYLFCGPRGTGKTSSARIFAKAINCERGPAAEPCGECHQCVSIADGSNLDVFEIDAASHTQVDKIRDFIVEKVHFTPVAARHKVYIIDEVHKLSTSSFNALLKTLEEPPSHVVFILATTHPHEMPATILSRCQRYDFRPLTASETERHLMKIARAESLEVDVDAARQLARAADGSLRDALVLFEQAVVFSDGRVTREKVLDLLGGVGYEVLEEMLMDLVGGQSAGALRRLDEWIGRGRDLKRLAESFQEHLRMMLLLKVKSEDQTIRHLSEEERASLDRLCGAMTVGAITSWLRQVMELLASIRGGHAARLEWEMLLVACAQPEIDPSLQGLERRLERIELGGAPSGGGSGEGGVDPRLLARLEALESAPRPSAGAASADPRLLARLEALESAPRSSAGAPTADPRVLARLEALESAPKTGGDSGGDPRLLARVEALEAGEGQAHDPRLWEKLTRLEAELDAWKDRVRFAPAREESFEPSVEEPPTPQAPARPEPVPVSAEAPTPRPEPAAPAVTFPEGVLARDAVDDWFDMPALLVDASKFRQELPLFSSFEEPEPEFSPPPEPEEEEDLPPPPQPEVRAPVEPPTPPQPEVRAPVEPPTPPRPEVRAPVEPPTPPQPEVRVPVEPPTPPQPEVRAPVEPPTPPQPEVRVPVEPPAPEPVVSVEVVEQVQVVTTTTTTVTAPAPAAALEIDLKDFWRSMMLTVRERDKRLHAVLTDARLTAVEAERFEIALPGGFEWHRDKLQEGRKMLETVASELAGGRVLVMECTLGGEKAAPPKESEHEDLVTRASGVFGGATIVE